MKRLLGAFVMIALSCALSVFGYFYVNNTFDEIVYIAENSPEETADVWREKKMLMSVFLKNSDIDSIDEEIYALEQYAQQSDSEEIFDCIKQIKAVVNSVREGEEFNIGNIF